MIFCASSIVIFGGTGDLSTRKLIPALCRLESAGLLIKDFNVFVTGRSEMSDSDFRQRFKSHQKEAMNKDQTFNDGFKSLEKRIIYISANPREKNAAATFRKKLEANENEAAPARLFYLAVPPSSMEEFIALIKPFSIKNATTGCPVRILVEKPFGHDLKSSIELNDQLLANFKENQILRIDHYLGKEAVQNLLFMRFANTFFEPVWNNSYIENVQISFAETIGIEKRADYFDQTGILRDVVQNHLLQVLCMMAMEPPISDRMSDIHLEKTKVLKAIRKYSPEQVPKETVRARYTNNKDKNLKGYLEEDGVSADSATETFAACRLFIDNWRWSGVPFYLKAGKRLNSSFTEICICFKKLPHSIFTDIGEIDANRIYFRIQPDEGVTLKLNSKPPGMQMKMTNVSLNFSYQSEFGSYRPDAYERLLLDALKGDSALFLSNKEIEEAWKFIDPIIESWHRKDSQPIFSYTAGSEGPSQACELLESHGHRWYPLSLSGCNSKKS
jgi:glucose-6-phosphate 1-dehydrogenase